MSVNSAKPHLMVLPEDDANSEMAKGFEICLTSRSRFFQVLPPSGGWSYVVQAFKDEHLREMRANPHRHMILLIDFDEKADRFKKVSEVIPPELKSRVFVIGSWKEPESLKRLLRLKRFEDIGRAVGKNCAENVQDFWRHDLLKHNISELCRLENAVRPFLFE